jgi:hypothetical protein
VLAPIVVRIRTRAAIAVARIPIQVDVGFGDAIIPGPVEIDFPRCSMRRRRICAPIRSGQWWRRNSTHSSPAVSPTARPKDFYDLWLIAETFELAYPASHTDPPDLGTARDGAATENPAIRRLE